MLKIWGRDNSINVQKVLWCCDELNLPYQRIDAGANSGDLDTPAYRALNPNGRVPTIEDEAYVLWESNAILRYLCAKHGADPFWPANLEIRAAADRWMDWHMSTLWAEMRPLFIQLVRSAAAEPDTGVIDAARESTLAALGILDRHLASNPYVAGACFTVGDIPLGLATHRWMTMPIKRPVLTHLEAWYARLAERSFYRRVLASPLT